MAQVLGEDVMLWIWRFLMIGMVLFGALIMVNSFYSNQDVRAAEALSISGRVLDCISDKGVVNPESIDADNLLKCTNINAGEIYINATLTSILVNKSASIGKEFELICGVKELEIKNKNIYCLRQKYYVVVENKSATLNLLVGINKVEKNV